MDAKRVSTGDLMKIIMWWDTERGTRDKAIDELFKRGIPMIEVEHGIVSGVHNIPDTYCIIDRDSYNYDDYSRPTVTLD